MSETADTAQPTEPADAITGQSEHATLARVAVRSTVWATIGNYGVQVIGFAAMLLMTRLLNADAFGYFALGGFWLSVVNLRPMAGLDYAAIQQPRTDGALLGTHFVLQLSTAGLSLLLGLAAALVLPRFGYAPEVGISLLALLIAEGIMTLTSTLGMVLEKEIQISRLTLVTLAAYVVAYTLSIALALSGAGLWSLLSINILLSLVTIVGVYWMCRRRFPNAFAIHWRFDRALARKLLRQGISTGLANTMLATIVMRFDNFLIGTFVGAAMLGYYDRAYRIASWPGVLLAVALSRVGFLTFSKVQNDLPRLAHAVRLSLWAVTTLGIPIALTLLFGASDIVAILYGPKWSQSAYFLQFLTLYSAVWPVVSIGMSLSIALGHARVTLGLSVAQAIIITTVATPLTLIWGYNGTLLGVGITMASAFVMSSFYMLRQTRLTVREIFGPPALATLVASSALYLLTHAPWWGGWHELARAIVIGVVALAAFLPVLFILQPAEIIARLQYLRRTF